MTEFKPGDRVRRVAPSPSPFGGSTRPEERGVVTSGYTSPDNIPVLWEDGHERGVLPRVIEVIKENTPEPADEDTQALRERLLDLAVRAAGFEDTHATIVEAAQAFETYITGGTK